MLLTLSLFIAAKLASAPPAQPGPPQGPGGVVAPSKSAAPQRPPANPPKSEPKAKDDAERRERDRRMKEIRRTENEGIPVRLKDMARFRGVRANHLMGVGVVFGLDGTGDTKKNPQAARAIANYLRGIGQDVDAATIEPKNGALVMVTADLPPFVNNGAPMDVTVSTLGDAKSLRGGTLLRTELYAVGDNETIYAVAMGEMSVGGYVAGGGGNKEQVGFTTTGRIPAGAIIERGAPTKLVYDGHLYLELLDPDFTTAQRAQEAIEKKYPEFHAFAEDAGTIRLDLPANLSPNAAMARIEPITVLSDESASVVINERTGSIVIGGNVRLSPVVIATGSISVRIAEELSVSQPAPFSDGSTVVVGNQTVSATEGEADVAVLAPNTTIADLARIFQELRLKATEIINILQMLRAKGALKARLVIQ